MGCKNEVPENVFEPIAIIGQDNELHNDDLKTLMSKIGLRLIVDTKNVKRGLALATVQRGSKISEERAVRLAGSLSPKERTQLFFELKSQLNEKADNI